MFQHARPALLHLLHAFEYAESCSCGAWEFALNREHLCEGGLREADIRWMVLSEWLWVGIERTGPRDRSRQFEFVGGSQLTAGCCFLLTPRGARHLARELSYVWANVVEPSIPLNPFGSFEQIKPTWDKQRRALWWTDQIIKQFRVAARNQEIVLQAFEEENWPPRIYDPLPSTGRGDAKRRLHDTIISLNRSRKAKIIRFLGDGTGEGVRWEIELPSPKRSTSTPSAG